MAQANQKPSLFPYLGLLAAFAILLGTLGISYWSMVRSLQGFEGVIHHMEMFDQHLRLFVDLKEAEDRQREYLLMGEASYLAPYRAAAVRIGERLERMQALAADDPTMQVRVREIGDLTVKRLALLRQAADRRAEGGLPAALEIVRTGEGARTMDQIRQLVLELELEDMTLLKHQHDRAHETAALTILTMTTAIILSLLTAGALIWKIRRDLEERRQLERRLLEEAKLAEIARLLGDIGHDVKNMLMPIMAGADLLHQQLTEYFAGLPDAEAARAKETRALSQDVLEMTRNSSRRIQERVREIADAVKGQTAPLSFGRCDLARLADNVIGTLRLYAQERGVSLRTEGLDTLPTILADERRLFNALYNLINNAIPEVPPGGSVTVRGREDDVAKSVELLVIDTGRGMPLEVRDRLFSSAARSLKPGGTGLGTKIVKDVITAHGGTISVDSQVGLGTTFRLRLPITGPGAAPS